MQPSSFRQEVKKKTFFPIEAAGPILIAIIWGWVSWLDVIISCQTKKLNLWKMKPVMIRSAQTPVMEIIQKYRSLLLQKISFGGISSDLLWREKFQLKVH